MKPLLTVIGWLAMTSPAMASTERLAEVCDGTETLQVGAQIPRSLPNHLAFNADLAAGTYCYDKCGRDQTYPIKDAERELLLLTFIDTPAHRRELVFDRRTGVLTDYQSFDAGLGRIVRAASAKCRTAP